MSGHVDCLVTADHEASGAVGTGLVVLVREGKEFDKQKKNLHTSLVWRFNVVHVCGRDCVKWSIR